jgi:hypothetical protein
MPLTLVTGPANAAKAGAVLGRLAAANRAGRRPVLVVPTAADLAAYRRELAAQPDTVLGPQIVLFDGLVDLVARRVGLVDRPLSRTQCERVVAAVARRLDLAEDRPLAASARTAGFAAAAARFLGELSATGQAPGRLIAALRTWGEEVGRPEYAADLAAFVGGYADALRALGRPDAEGHARRATDALRLDPGAWGGTPVHLYGFDDLTAIERDVVETLALDAVAAPVVLSLPAEPGRAALVAGAGLVADLTPLAAEEVMLPADDRHYADRSRDQLHAVERGLFEPGAARAPEGDAVVLLEGGGERAELELVAARIAGLLAAGWGAGEIAVVARNADAAAAAVVDVLGEFGVPATARRTASVVSTALGRGLVALLRCALDPTATAADLLAYLRTPGVVARAGFVDELEAWSRSRGVRELRPVRERWEQERWPLDAIDRIGVAAGRGTTELVAVIDVEAARLFALPYRTQGEAQPRLDADGRDEALALRAIRRWAQDLGELARADVDLAPAPQEVPALLGALRTRLGTEAGPDAVAVLDPLQLRARRVRGLFFVRAQEQELPALVRPDPFLDDDDRRALTAATGIRLPLSDDPLAAERHLFYSAVSRPTELLAVSWHAADDDAGRPRNRSPFVDDLCDVLAPDVTVERRPLGAVAWAADAPPPAPGPARRSAIVQGPRRREGGVASLTDPLVLAAIDAHDTYSATALEALLDCPVKWFVERWLRGRDLEPAAEPLARGSLAHAVLQDVFEQLGGPLTPSELGRARALLHASLERHAAERPISVVASRARASARRLEAELDRYLAHAATPNPVYAPAAFEVAFGEEQDEHPAVPLGERLRVKGRIDRVDVEREPAGDRPRAVIVDYKASVAPAQGDWLADRKVQAAVYLHAARAVLDLDVGAALYQPLRGRQLTARGARRDDVRPDFPVHDDDALDAEAFDALLRDVGALVEAAVARVRTGELVATPHTCAFRGTCAHPALCRREALA